MMLRKSGLHVHVGRIGTAIMFGLFASCSGAPKEAATLQEKVAVGIAAQAEALGGGTIPLPIKASDPDALAWNGSYAELLAMDSWAVCSLSQRLGTSPDAFRQGELFFSLLSGRHGEAVEGDLNLCGGIDTTDPDLSNVETILQEWITDRKNPQCNVNPITRKPEGLDVDFTTTNADSSAYALPSVSDLGLDGFYAGEARVEAQDQVQYAFLNLCIAKRMQDHLESVEVTLASRDVLQEIARVVRERALTAVFQMSLLAKAFGISEAPGTIDNPHKIVPVLVAWRNWLGDHPERLAELGRDFASALSTFVDASLDHTQLLLRTADANKNAGSYRSVTALDAVQRRILAGPRVFTAVEGFGPFADTEAKSVAVDMSAPQIGVLLGLARAADALRISASSSTIDIATNSQVLLDAVEVHVRQVDCDAQGDASPTCAAIPSGTAAEDYVVTKRFEIQPEHAATLVRALVEHLFGQPADPSFQATGQLWHYVSQQGLRLPTDINERLTGNHTYTGNFATSGGGTLAIDPNFAFSTDVRRLEDQTWAYLPPRRMDQDIHPMEQGLGFRSAWLVRVDALGDAAAQGTAPVLQLERPVGSVPVLAAAREALLTVDSSVQGYFDAAKPGLDLLEKVIGSQSVLIRPKVADVVVNDATLCNLLWSKVSVLLLPDSCHRVEAQVDGDEHALFDIDIVTGGGDSPSMARRSLLAPTGSGCSMGCALGSLTEPQDIPLSVVATPVAGSDHKILHGTVAAPTGRGVDISLVLPDDQRQSLYLGELDAAEYVDRATGEAISNTWRNEQYYINFPPPPVIGSNWVYAGPALNTNLGRASGLGGHFGVELERAWLVQNTDWSKPLYDALGLRVDFAPMGDASLYGGVPGDEAYRYFLQRAGEAASEATQALQGAVDTLVAEAEDHVRLTQEEIKGQEIPALEMKALCGEQGPCVVGSSLVFLQPAPCTEFVNYCANTQKDIVKIMGPAGVLATPVVQQLKAGLPNFNKYSGGELERLFVQQWNAWKELQGAAATVMRVRSAANDQLKAALAEMGEATADYSTVSAEVDLAYQEVSAVDMEAEAQRQVYLSQAGDYQSQVDLAKANMDTWCDPDVLSKARANATAFSGKHLSYGLWTECVHAPEFAAKSIAKALGAVFAGSCGDDEHFTVFCPEGKVCGAQSESYNPGAEQATQDRCTAAQNEYNYKITLINGAPNPFGNANQGQSIVASLQQLAAALEDKTRQHNLNYAALAARLAAARSRREAGYARAAASASNAEAQVTAQLMGVQAAWGKVVESRAAIHEAEEQAKLRVARFELENQLATTDIQSRFGLRRRFHSFDLWRARALSENARRVAVTARRAIESRFVVDLSEMSAPEPFVEAPSVWSDDIYDSDLKPPTSLGLTAAPNQQGGAVYLNKLTDYVNNLELFVNGFALARPRAAVQVDTDVLQLPAPAAVNRVPTADGAVHPEISPESMGWSFFCDKSAVWIRHPNSAQFDVASFDLSTACNGVAPSLARLGFWLDPWGRVDRQFADVPFSERHNARWRQLAVNLVGAGVRDCSLAPDPQACYAEPFIQFDLRQVGPAWVTNYERSWRALQVPTAIIEGGKALASEEWLDPVANSFEKPEVANVARGELAGRPLGGFYELVLRLTPDVKVDHIQRIQILAQTDYWVREETGNEPEVGKQVVTCGDGVMQSPETCEYGGGMGVPVCPTALSDCNDNDPCTVDSLVGSPILCTSECRHETIGTCANSDGCCAVGCNFETDKDCNMATCGDGTLECDANQVNGCESLSSAQNCGACDTPCNTSFPHVATASCPSEACQITCSNGFGNCDAAYTNGCETPLNTMANCGGCGAACALANATSSCSSMGVCQLVTCNATYFNCNGTASDGCEQQDNCFGYTVANVPSSQLTYTPSSPNWNCTASTTLSANITNTATSLTVGSGSTFGAAPFSIIIDSEIMNVTAVSSNTFTVQRAQQGTTAAAHTSAAVVGGVTIIDSTGTGSTCAAISGDTCGGTTTLDCTNSVTQAPSGGPPLMVLRMRGLTVTNKHVIKLKGDKPIVFTVNGNVVIDGGGTIDAGANLTTAGPGGAGNTCAAATGSANSANPGGGGGGGFGTAGGNGGGPGTGGSAAGTGGGTTASTLVPLRGGCPGGSGGVASGAANAGGAGGGAFQISAVGSITVGHSGDTATTTGILSAEGGASPGARSVFNGSSSAGGGSGGGVLLEAKTVTISANGALRVHGGASGGGGDTAGAGGNGENGHYADDTKAAGGTAGSGIDRAGAQGGLCSGASCATTSAAGANGTGGNVGNAGGGGGGGRALTVQHP